MITYPFCKYCPKLYYHGDYDLYYCDITRRMVAPDDYCSVVDEVLDAVKKAFENEKEELMKRN